MDSEAPFFLMVISCQKSAGPHGTQKIRRVSKEVVEKSVCSLQVRLGRTLSSKGKRVFGRM